MNGDKFVSFMKGLFLGAIAGATAGILLAPKSGEETREDLKKLAKEYQDKAMDLYTVAKKIVERKMRNLKAAGEKLDENKYMELVTEVIEEIKKDGRVTADVAKKLSTQLKSDWNMIKTEFEK
jgi:gas vesicle protein